MRALVLERFNAPLTLVELPRSHAKSRRSARADYGEIMRESTKLADAEKLNPFLNPNRFTLATALEAHAMLEFGKANGKLVVDVAEEVSKSDLLRLGSAESGTPPADKNHT